MDTGDFTRFLTLLQRFPERLAGTHPVVAESLDHQPRNKRAGDPLHEVETRYVDAAGRTVATVCIREDADHLSEVHHVLHASDGGHRSGVFTRQLSTYEPTRWKHGTDTATMLADVDRLARSVDASHRNAVSRIFKSGRDMEGIDGRNDVAIRTVARFLQAYAPAPLIPRRSSYRLRAGDHGDVCVEMVRTGVRTTYNDILSQAGKAALADVVSPQWYMHVAFAGTARYGLQRYAGTFFLDDAPGDEIEALRAFADVPACPDDPFTPEGRRMLLAAST
jgi:hypothetical protein